MTRFSLIKCLGLMHLGLFCLGGTACTDPAETTVDARPTASPQDAGWPDTTAAPYVPLDRLLRPPFGSGTYLTDGILDRHDLCPPCPLGAQCEPCLPDGFYVRSRAPGGTAEIRVEGTQALPSVATLAEGQAVVLTVDASVSRTLERGARTQIEDSTEYVTYAVRGLRRLERQPDTRRVWPASGRPADP